jgi:hypothetical protein
MFVVSHDKVYILDKVEGNANQINGHSQYASIWLVFLFSTLVIYSNRPL